MSEVSIEEVKKLLDLLDILTPRQRKFFLQTMNKKQMKVFEVACFNLATNHRGLSKKQLATLSKFKTPVEILASKGYKLSEKRRVVNQKGGFFGALIPLLGTVITSFLTQ